MRRITRNTQHATIRLKTQTFFKFDKFYNVTKLWHTIFVMGMNGLDGAGCSEMAGRRASTT